MNRDGETLGKGVFVLHLIAWYSFPTVGITLDGIWSLTSRWATLITILYPLVAIPVVTLLAYVTGIHWVLRCLVAVLIAGVCVLLTVVIIAAFHDVSVYDLIEYAKIRICAGMAGFALLAATFGWWEDHCSRKWVNQLVDDLEAEDRIGSTRGAKSGEGVEKR